MARPKNQQGTERLDLRPSPDVVAYLDQIVAMGLYGKTRSEVARMLVGDGIRRLLESGLLADQRSLADVPVHGSMADS